MTKVSKPIKQDIVKVLANKTRKIQDIHKNAIQSYGVLDLDAQGNLAPAKPNLTRVK